MAKIEAVFSEAVSALNSGDASTAEKKFRQVLRSSPSHLGALNLIAVALMSGRRFAEAEPFVARAIKLGSRSDVSFYNHGLILKEIGQPAKAVECFDQALALKPSVAATWNNRGVARNDLADHDAALQDFERAIELQPNYLDAHLNRARTLLRLKRFEQALQAYGNVAALQPRFAEAHLVRADILGRLRRFDEAANEYGAALSIDQNDSEAWFGCGNALLELQRFDDAARAYEKALAIKPSFTGAAIGRANALRELGWVAEAAAALEAAVATNPDLAEAWLALGQALQMLRRHGEAIAAYDRALALKPDLIGLQGARLHLKMQMCDWSNFDAECAAILDAARGGRLVMPPFTMLTIPSSANDQLQYAKAWSRELFPATARGPAPPATAETESPHEKIRIGYLSSDFHEHATSHLIVSVIEAHDKSRFDVIGLSTGPDDNSALRQRIAAGFSRFEDLSTLGDDQIAARVRDARIDILVDLKGFTAEAKTAVLRGRPAPIQVNFLGYPGTMGAPFVDYLIGDRVVIGDAERACYSEKIVWMPHSYQPNDNRRAIAEATPTREDCGLPQDGFVFCCFNAAYKITPDVFGSWMRILHAVEDSVLWLLDSPAASDHLRQAAQEGGIAPSRLVFAKRMPPAEHLARQRLAGLFLDTLPYNAHTTASDALWAGLPVLTRQGDTFAGRVAASLLHAAGLPELIAPTRDAYETLAIELARDRQALARIRTKLIDNRSTMPLFDTALFAKHLEQAYRAMIDRHRRGLPPDHIVVAL